MQNFVRSFQNLTRSRSSLITNRDLTFVKYPEYLVKYPENLVNKFFVMACLRKCRTYHKKSLALKRKIELFKRRANLESTPDQRKKIVKAMVEKYYREFICHKC